MEKLVPLDIIYKRMVRNNKLAFLKIRVNVFGLLDFDKKKMASKYVIVERT